MSYWYAYHDLLSCGGPIFLFRRKVPCTTNIPFRNFFYLPLPLLSLPEYGVGVP